MKPNFLFILFIAALISCVPVSAQQDSLSRETIEKLEKLVPLQDQLVGQGKYREAKSVIKEILSLKPGRTITVMMLNNYASVCERLKQYDEALLSYSAALARDEQNSGIRNNRALFFAKIGKIDDAILDYSYLIAQNPDNEVYKYKRSMLYIAKEEYANAELDLLSILDKNDKSMKAQEGLALVYTLTQRYNEAEKIYDRLLEKLPNEGALYEGKARVYLMTGKTGFALRDIRKAIEKSPGPSASMYLLRAEIFKAMGDKKSAKLDEETARSMGAGE